MQQLSDDAVTARLSAIDAQLAAAPPRPRRQRPPKPPKTPRNQPDAEGMLTCTRCGQRAPAATSFRQTSARGAARQRYYAMPCLNCRRAIAPCRVQPGLLETPCPYCRQLGVKGAAAWANAKQRRTHVARCKAGRAAEDQRCAVPCQVCGATGAHGAPRWASPAQRSNHVSRCRTAATAQPKPAAPKPATPKPAAPKGRRIIGDLGQPVPNPTYGLSPEEIAQHPELRHPTLTVDQQRELPIEELYAHTYRLIWKLAGKHARRCSTLTREDLYHDGVIGMLRAGQDYDRRGAWTTYAIYWINRAMVRAIADKERLIRLPVHSHDALVRYHTGKDPAVPEAHLTRLRQIDGPVLSFSHQIVGRGGDPMQLGDIIADPNAVDPAEVAVDHSLSAILAQVMDMAKLSDRERQVLRLRHGLDDDTPRTLHEVGEIIGVTRERARQIEKDALHAIRLVAAKVDLRAYYR